MTIQLPPDLEERLKVEAARQGVEPGEYAQRLIAESLPPLPQPSALPPLQPKSLAQLFAEWDAEDGDAIDPEELARREREFQEFAEGMNRNRLEMEGPNSRKVYP